MEIFWFAIFKKNATLGRIFWKVYMDVFFYPSKEVAIFIYPQKTIFPIELLQWTGPLLGVWVWFRMWKNVILEMQNINCNQ